MTVLDLRMSVTSAAMAGFTVMGMTMWRERHQFAGGQNGIYRIFFTGSAGHYMRDRLGIARLSLGQ